MSYNECIANANTAFGSGEFATSLKYAELAIKEEPKETDGYFCAGKACMSLDKPSEASEFLKKAIDIDKKTVTDIFFSVMLRLCIISTAKCRLSLNYQID